MFSDESVPSCSDCKLELIQKKWTQILLNWINNCVSPKVKKNCLDLRSLIEVVKKYKWDICVDDFDVALLDNDDLEQFIKYKYPILRLRYLSDNKDSTKKLYIMASMLLYHCCANSKSGDVDHDICTRLLKREQEMIIRFCEILSEMERTINNVDCAIRGAFEHPYQRNESFNSAVLSTKSKRTVIDGDSTSVASVIKSNGDEAVSAIDSLKKLTLKFKSSVTVMPSVLSDASSYLKSDTSEFKPVEATRNEEITEEGSGAMFNLKTNEDRTVRGDSSELSSV